MKSGRLAEVVSHLFWTDLKKPTILTLPNMDIIKHSREGII